MSWVWKGTKAIPVGLKGQGNCKIFEEHQGILVILPEVKYNMNKICTKERDNHSQDTFQIIRIQNTFYSVQVHDPSNSFTIDV